MACTVDKTAARAQFFADGDENPLGSNYTFSGLVRDQSSGRTWERDSAPGTDRPQVPGGRVDLNGTDQYVEVADHADFSFTNGTSDTPCTITAWVNPDSNAGFRAVTKWGTTNATREWWFGTNASGLLTVEFRDSDGDDIGRQYSVAVPTGVDSHIAVTYDGSESSGGIRLYVDGKRVYDTDVSTGTYVGMSDSSQVVQIGRLETTSHADGKVWNARIYNKELSAAQVREVYRHKLQPTGITNSTDLVAAWWLGEETGIVAYDCSGNGHHGTLKNNPTRTTQTVFTPEDEFGWTPAMHFDASNDHINLNLLATALAATTAGSWSLWARPDDPTPSGSQYLIGFSENADSAVGHIRLRLDTDGKLNGGAQNDSGTQQWAFTTDAAVFTNSTDSKHIALVHNGTEPVLYVDGSSVAITFSVSTDKTYWFADSSAITNGSIGCRPKLTATEFFGGSIRNVRFYTDALSSGEVTTLSNEGDHTDNLVSKYCDTKSPTKDLVEDEVGSNHGTPSGRSTDAEIRHRIPRLRGDQANDVRGKPCVFTDRAPWDGQLEDGGCLDLNGADQHVTLGPDDKISTAANGAAGVTVEAWVNLDSYPGASSRERIFTAAIDGTKSGISLSAYDSDKIEIGGRSVTSDSFQTVTASGPSTGTWAHVLGVLDFANDLVKVYINGVLKATATATFANTTFTKGTPDSAEEEGWGALIRATPSHHLDGKICGGRIFKSALSDAEAFNAYKGSEDPQGDSRANCIHWLSFSERNGKVVYDKMGTANGTLQNFVATQWDQTQNVYHDPEASGFTIAGTVNGTDERINCGSIGAVNDNSFSYSFWFATDSGFSGDDCLFSEGHSSLGGRSFRVLHRTGGKLRVFGDPDSGADIHINGDTVVTDGVMRHCCVTSDGTTIRLYLDGTEEASGSITGRTFTMNTCMIGCLHINTGKQNHAPATFENVRIYSAGLSASEVTDLSNGVDVTSNLIHKWLDQEKATSGSSVPDEVGSKNGSAENLTLDELYVCIPALHDGTSSAAHANIGISHVKAGSTGWNNGPATLDMSGGRTNIAAHYGPKGWAKFDGVGDEISFGDIGSLTALSMAIDFLADNQVICTLQNSTATAISVVAGVLTFGASLSASNIKVDGVTKTAAEAGALLNDNARHVLSFDLVSIAASNFKIGTDSSAFGNIQVSEVRKNADTSTWDLISDSLDSSGDDNHGAVTGATFPTLDEDLPGLGVNANYAFGDALTDPYSVEGTGQRRTCLTIGQWWNTSASLQPTIIASAESVETPSLRFGISPSTIGSGESIGSHAIEHMISIPQVDTGASVESPALLAEIVALVIGTAESVPSPSLPIVVPVTEIASGESFGSHQFVVGISPAAIASSESFGAHAVQIPVVIAPTSIATGESIKPVTVITTLDPLLCITAEKYTREGSTFTTTSVTT